MKYSPELRAEILGWMEANDCGTKAACTEFDVPRSTIKAWRKKARAELERGVQKGAIQNGPPSLVLRADGRCDLATFWAAVAWLTDAEWPDFDVDNREHLAADSLQSRIFEHAMDDRTGREWCFPED